MLLYTKQHNRRQVMPKYLRISLWMMVMSGVFLWMVGIISQNYDKAIMGLLTVWFVAWIAEKS